MKPLFFLLLLFAVSCQSPQKQGADTSTPPNTPTLQTPVQEAMVFDVVVEGMTCTGCEETIKNAVKSVDGVQWVTAAHAEGKVLVAITNTEPDTTSIKQKVEEAGYKVVSITPQPKP